MRSAPAVEETRQPAGRRSTHAGAVSVIIPVTKPTAEVGEVVRALTQELERLSRDHEFILVFDGVRGAAWLEAQRLSTERPEKVHTVGLQQSFGESVCLSAGYEKARGAILLTSPQYVQVDPSAIGPMLAAIDQGEDFVTSWRRRRVDPWLNRLQSNLFNWITRRIIHVKLHDLNCTFRAFRREVLEEMHLYGDMYRFLPAIAFRQGFRVTELEVVHLREWGGAGLFGVGVYARRLLDVLGMLFLAKFTLKPLRFFGAIGGLFMLLGGAMAAYIEIEHLVKGSGVYQRPLFLIGVLMLMLGVQIIGFGLVGEIIIYTQARNLREYRVERIWESRDDRERP
jgi:glycosyltransferase involved in cell wall biosynthesis